MLESFAVAVLAVVAFVGYPWIREATRLSK